MRIILSRKGFDSSYGGVASPIFTDGTMLSMPIPEDGDSGLLYSEIEWNAHTYDSIWKSLGGKKYIPNSYCHLDPDIRAEVRKNKIEKWQAAFGQCSSALGHLDNEGVKEGDIFLFFGRFRMADEKEMKYIDGAVDFQAIYGYLQIGNIVRGDDIKKYMWHPHSKEYGLKNALYLATEKLIIDDRETDLPGFGLFKFSDELRLTIENDWHISYWKKLPWMDNDDITMSYHRKRRYNDEKGYFESVKRGQEFVIDENDNVTEWALNIIKNNLIK